MKRIFCYILAIGAFITGAACSVVNEAIKSGDPQYAYEQALELYENGKWDQASTLFEACRHIYMGTPREDSLSFYNARCKFKRRNWEDASSLLDTYRRKFGRSPFIEEAEGMHALCYYYMSPPPEYDQTMTSQAIISITEFLSRYPNSEYVAEFNDMLEELTARLMQKSYLNAYTYYKIERYNSAIIAFRNALKQYPDSHRREDLMYYTVMSAYKYADNSAEDKQLDRFMEALDAYYTFVMEFPESKYRKELENIVERSRDFIDKNRKTE